MPQAKAPKQKRTVAAAAPGVGDLVTLDPREIVKHSTESAKANAEEILDASRRYGAEFESMLTRAAEGYAEVLNTFAEAAHSNLNEAIAAAEKLAEAETVQDAVQIQSHFVNAQAASAMENAQSLFDSMNTLIVQSSELMSQTVATAWQRALETPKVA